MKLFMTVAVVLGLSAPNAVANDQIYHGAEDQNSPGHIIGDVLTGRHLNRGHHYGRRYIVRRRVVRPYAESYQPRVVHPYDYSHDHYNNDYDNHHHYDHDGDDD